MGSSRVFFSAGEASGDAYAAALVRELESDRRWTFEGIGGPRSAAGGVRIIARSDRWGAISITQAVRGYPAIVRGYYRAKVALSSGEPGLFVPIDFGYVNLRLARHAKRQGWKVLYFVPPGSWRRDRQGKDIPRVSDLVVTPFSWSAEILRGMGADAYWFGHPIQQLLASRTPQARGHGIAVLPGSRAHEIESNVPFIGEALRGIDLPVEFAVASEADRDLVARRWGTNISATVGDTAGVLDRARVAIVCSGTATLEAALTSTPMVVVYRLTPAMRREAKLIRMKRPKFIALPNLLLERMAVPEFVDQEGSPEQVGQLVAGLREGSARDAQLAAFAEVAELLGPADAITHTADLIRSRLPK